MTWPLVYGNAFMTVKVDAVRSSTSASSSRPCGRRQKRQDPASVVGVLVVDSMYDVRQPAHRTSWVTAAPPSPPPAPSASRGDGAVGDLAGDVVDEALQGHAPLGLVGAAPV